MYQIKLLTEMKITQEINKHATLSLTAILHQDKGKDCITDIHAGSYVEITNSEKEYYTVFLGVVQKLIVNTTRDTYQLELIAASASYLTDVKKKHRSFQDENMPYKTLFEQVISDYENGGIRDKATNDAKTGKLIMQYNETDWEFLKRLASSFHAGLLPSMKLEGPHFYIGIPQGKERGSIEKYNYSVVNNISLYMKSSQINNPELMSLDMTEFFFSAEEEFEIGDELIFNQIKLYIKQKVLELTDGVLKCTYSLATKKGLLVSTFYNDYIIGLSLKGKVLERIQDNIKVKLEIDKEQSTETAWLFPYTTMYTAEGNSGLYWMPEVDDTVLIYFPTKEEADAVGVNSKREHIKSGDKISNPDIKYLRTKYGKELKFDENEILITCVNGKNEETGKDHVVYIRISDENGIELISTQPISISSEAGITMNSEKQIKIISREQIKMKCKTSQILVDTQVEIDGLDVKIN